jgi:hypothetical protein
LTGEVGHAAVSPQGLVAVVDAKSLWSWRGDAMGEHLVDLPQESHCVLSRGAELFVGTSEARLLKFADGELNFVVGFDDAPGRADWFTPWGGPPDVRSLATSAAGDIFAGVHVGGILRSSDGETWEPTGIDIGADVHQVIVFSTSLLASSAWGLGRSVDGGDDWEFLDEGLHGSYCRAVAASGDDVFVTASEGPNRGRAALYRLNDGTFEKLTGGLPEWFEGNIDTHCLGASDDRVAFGTAEGDVYLSEDSGDSFECVARGSPVRCLLLTDQ